MRDVQMKSFVILTGSLLLASNCCAMNEPKDNSFLLRRSAPPATNQPGIKGREETIASIDLSKMSVNSRAQHMTDFVAGQLAEGLCSYEGTLIGLEKHLKTKTTLNPDPVLACERDAAVLAWERADGDLEPREERIASKSNQIKHRPLDRTTSAGPALQSIVMPAPAAQPQTTSPSLAGPSTPDDSDDERFENTALQSPSESAPAVTKKSKRQNPQDDLVFDMDE